MTTGWSCETGRLVVRPWRESDLDDLQVMQTDPEVVRYVPWQVWTREESAAWLAKRRRETALTAEGDALSLAVERRTDGRVIGSVNAWWRSAVDRQGEVGWVLARDAQGQGYAAEAVTALVDVLLERLDLHRVTASMDARNEASARLARRLGMRQEAHFVESGMFKGELGDELVFAVLRREWLARQGP